MQGHLQVKIEKTKMENKNLFKNLFLKQFNQSNAIAYSDAFVSDTNNYNFQLLENAYRNTGKAYAKIKIAIETNSCQSEHCSVELAQLKQLEEAPQASLDFLTLLVAELADNGVCIILISSELPEILGMCDRTIVIREGKIAGKFTKEESTEEKLFSFASGVAI